jgi:hypothetical protein
VAAFCHARLCYLTLPISYSAKPGGSHGIMAMEQASGID